MPQHRLDRVGRVALHLGQQVKAAGGVTGLRMTGPAGRVPDRPHEQEMLAVLRGRQMPDRVGPAAAGGEGGQHVPGNAVRGDAHHFVHRLAARRHVCCALGDPRSQNGPAINVL